jgi:hypothetical protein
MQSLEKVVTVFQGRLMSPREMNEAISDTRLEAPISSNLRSSWYLCGDVSEEFYQLAISGNSPGYSLAVFSTPGGTVFATFVLQLRDWQARFLLPFSSEKCGRFLEQIERTGLYLSLGRNGGRQALLVQFQCLPELLGPLQAYSKVIKGLPCDIPDRDLQIAGQHILGHSSVPSAHPHFAVEHVCMTVVLD